MVAPSFRFHGLLLLLVLITPPTHAFTSSTRPHIARRGSLMMAGGQVPLVPYYPDKTRPKEYQWVRPRRRRWLPVFSVPHPSLSLPDLCCTADGYIQRPGARAVSLRWPVFGRGGEQPGVPHSVSPYVSPTIYAPPPPPHQLIASLIWLQGQNSNDPITLYFNVPGAISKVVSRGTRSLLHLLPHPPSYTHTSPWASP